MERVVVLGVTGMLGSLTAQYLRQLKQVAVWGTARDSERKQLRHRDRVLTLDVSDSDTAIEHTLKTVRPRWLINCIGVIKPYCPDDDPAGVRRAIAVNALFPFRLADIAAHIDARVIQIATDCVFSGRHGHYDEAAPHDPTDAYGRTKSLGEVVSDRVLHIRCSIIGPEPWYTVSLLEWFLRRPDGAQIPGFTRHRWNGVTTLQFARVCAQIVTSGADSFAALRQTSSVHHFVPNETVSKYELLRLCASVFGKPVTIVPAAGPGPALDRSLDTRYRILVPFPHQKPMREALQELKTYIDAERLVPSALRDVSVPVSRPGVNA